MPHRLFQPDRPNQKSTNLFVEQIFIGNNKLGQKTFLLGNENYSNADELNEYKEDISKANGLTMSQTHIKTKSIFKDENDELFYYEWDDKIGNVKTMLNNKPVTFLKQIVINIWKQN